MAYAVHWVGYGQDNTHGVYKTLEEAQDSVRAWWKKNDFEPFYIRQWGENPIIWVA